MVPTPWLCSVLALPTADADTLSGACSAFGSYITGLVATILVMNYAGAAQPALLYIVPAVLGGVLGHALIKGELQQVRCSVPGWTRQARSPHN